MVAGLIDRILRVCIACLRYRVEVEVFDIPRLLALGGSVQRVESWVSRDLVIDSFTDCDSPAATPVPPVA